MASHLPSNDDHLLVAQATQLHTHFITLQLVTEIVNEAGN